MTNSGSRSVSLRVSSSEARSEKNKRADHERRDARDLGGKVQKCEKI